MLERIIIAATLFFMAAIMWHALKMYRKYKAGKADPEKLIKTGRPAVLYFWADNCSVCKSVQKPAIEFILSANIIKDLQFVAIDVSEKPDLTNEWGVMTVPSSFVINKNGICKYINSGLVSREDLTRQLLSI